LLYISFRTASKIVETTRTIEARDIQLDILQNLLNKFPPAGSIESEEFLRRSLARMRVEQFQSEVNFEHEMDFEQRIKLLKKAISLYSDAGDTDNYQRTLRLLQETHRVRGAELEKEVANEQGFEDKARAYEEAAAAYTDYCAEERKHCLNIAAELRSKAAREAETLPCFNTVLAALEHAEHAIARDEGPEGISLAFRGEPEGISVSGSYVVVRSWSPGHFLYPLDSHDKFFRWFSSYCQINVTDPAIKELFENLMKTIGETTTYCPTPEMMPQWIITTKFSKIALALTAATFTGALSGVSVGGMNLKAVLVGVVGAHAAILVNLLSNYLLMDDDEKGKVSGLTEQYIKDPTKMSIILELNKRPQTIRELCTTSRYSDNKMRQTVKSLEKDGILREKAGTKRPVLWELTRPL
jgi:hypothetical protein